MKQDSFAFRDGEAVVFIGDSITDMGRRDAAAPLGNGYVKIATDLITAKYPSLKLHYFNEGIGMHMTSDLRNRWTDDVLSRDPDWVTVMIGINDINMTVHEDQPWAIPVSPREYEESYRDILTRSAAQNSKFVLLDSFYISKESQAGTVRARFLELLPSYLQVVEGLASEFGAIRVRTHEIFQEQLKHRSADDFCPEPIHPNATGHTVIAYALLDALGW